MLIVNNTNTTHAKNYYYINNIYLVIIEIMKLDIHQIKYKNKKKN